MQAPRKRGDARSRNVKIFAGQRNREVEKQIEPEAKAREESAFIASAVAKEAESFFAVVLAKAGWIQTQQPGVEFFRHNAPLRFSWRGRRAKLPQAAVLRREPVCGPWKRAGSSVDARQNRHLP